MNVEFPTVIRAADAILFDAAIEQARSSMTAMFDRESSPSLLVAEQDQVLPEQTYPLWHITWHVRGNRDRMPIPPQQFPHRRARTNFGEQGIVGIGFASVTRPLINRANDRCFL